ncbi:MAG: hypothetical protein K9G48_03410 [Reyranella sp.]|nr:hypothetical protein [Reyranella sp.]
MQGLSGRRYRAFINNLIDALPRPRYLEIGAWAGSTLCSAIFGNKVEAVAIDNWSQFGGPFGRFYTNLAAFKGSARVSFVERDFRQIDYASLGTIFGPFTVYLFDGPHEFQDQYDGLRCVQPALDRCYVQIVDDWNWHDVRAGTAKAIEDLGLQTEFKIEIRTTLNDEHAPQPAGENSDWHNGYCISVLSRPS